MGKEQKSAWSQAFPGTVLPPEGITFSSLGATMRPPQFASFFFFITFYLNIIWGLQKSSKSSIHTNKVRKEEWLSGR